MKQVKIAKLRTWSHAKLIQGSFLTRRTFSCSFYVKQQQQHESEAESSTISFPWKNQQSHPIIPSSDIQSWLPGRLLNHPLNEMTSLNATKYTIPLGDIVGLKHAPVHLVTLQAGQMSTVDHFHHHTEEWIYIIDGEGTAIIDGKDFQIEKGTFLGFKRTESGPSHNLKNTSNTGKDLVYLCGGERRNFDVCIYPTVEKIMVTEAPNTVKWVDSINDAKPSISQLPNLQSPAMSSGTKNEENITIRALLTNNEADVIVGETGTNLAAIKNASGVYATVSEAIPGSNERILTVNGEFDEVANAFSIMSKDLMTSNKDVTVRFLVSHQVVKNIIGTSGKTVKEIEQKSGAYIDTCKMPLPKSTERVLYISGSADSIQKAMLYIGNSIVDEQSHAAVVLYSPSEVVENQQSTVPTDNARNDQPFQKVLKVPAALVGGIIGSKSSKIKKIRSESNAEIHIPRDSDPITNERTITIKGTEAAIEKATELVNIHLENEKARKLAQNNDDSVNELSSSKIMDTAI